MDGVDNSTHRRVFLMTTNEINLNQNYLERPSRIRYIKTYNDLKLETINQVVDDILIHKHHKNDCVEFISKLNIITIDIVKAIISEVNIHNQAPQEFQDFFNVKTTTLTYEIYEVIDNNTVLYSNDIEHSRITLPPPFKNDYLGRYMEVYNREMGEVINIIDNNNIVIKDDFNVVKTYRFIGKEKKHKSFIF
jgi:hypothetical protein